jgi:hypothetical protein
MDTCPHCAALAITGWRKVNATSIRPARCPTCGGLSYVAGWYHVLASLLSEVLIWGSIVLAVVLHSWLVLLFLPLGLAVLFWLHSSGTKLHPIDAATVSRARIRAIFEVLAFAALVVAAYLLFGHH